MTIPDSLAALVRDADRDRYLSVLYAAVETRPALFALHALDLELAKVVATTTDAMIGEIRLAWWREALLKLDLGIVPVEPILTAIAAHVLPSGVSGRGLEPLEDAFNVALLADPLGGADLAAYADRRGGVLFAALATVLGDDPAIARRWGIVWALGDLVRQPWLDRVDETALSSTATAAPERAPAALRPLAGLAALARRDLARWRAGRPVEPRGSVVRQARLLACMINGR